jgi:hypothetical protein
MKNSSPTAAMMLGVYFEVQILMVWSRLAEASRAPSGENATAWM